MRKSLHFAKRLLPVLIVSLVASAYVEAQPGYRNHRRHHGYSHNSYRYYNHRPLISLGLGSPYGYGYGRGYHYQPYRNYHYRPAPFGIHINVLPYGYSRVMVNSGLFFYLDGIFYRRYSDNHYETVSPPLGAVVAKIPRAAKLIVINSQTYYEFDGTYYQEEMRDNDVWYKVVGVNGSLNTDGIPSPQTDEFGIGQQFEHLPADCTVVVRMGQKYFKSPDNIYFQEIVRESDILYEVVPAPGN